MKSQNIEVAGAVGKVLLHPVFHPSGRKLLAKGRQISEEDVRLLCSEGHQEVKVAVLEPNEVSEEDAAVQIASEICCGSMELRVAAGGRVNLTATEDGCILVDENGLRDLNRSGVVTAATLPGFSFVLAGQRVGTVKSAPFAVPKAQFDGILQSAQQWGPLIQARPARNPVVAVLYSDPFKADRARSLFDGITRTRLERFGTRPAFVLSCLEEEGAVARSLEHLLRARPTVLLVASTTAPAGPDDVIGRAMRRAGCRIESFLAPVEPGNLLLLGYHGETPVVAAPGCFRSPKANVIDLILPPLLAQYQLGVEDISSLGHGGLLQ